ncbi:alpha/beta-hydrolase [Aspergillus cavernicola]|uniref:Alpha/beta-hydrolase n=1 Tax=Aspergillus cavernicola TaxID=176166 RepID=A0ABR4HYA4_9EURO
MFPSSTTPTTILFIPGAWHSPTCYNNLLPALQVSSYNTELIHLPSVNPSTPHKDFTEDVLHIRSRIESAASAGHKIILSEAVKGLDWESQQKQKQPDGGKQKRGGVTHVFYCCSFLIPEGESLVSAFGGVDLPWYRISEDRRVVMPAGPGEVFYNDMEVGEVERAVAELKPHSYMNFHSVVGYAAWKYVPSTYLYCLRDAAIPIEVQRMMVEEVAKGVAIRTETVDSSHSPFYSVPGEVVRAIRRAAGEVV